MKNGDSKLNLYEYTDYRQFLKDWFAASKATRNAYSYRVFSRKAGFKSTNFIMLVIQGHRNLSEESLNKCLYALHLNKQEQEFFRNLVFFNQSQTHQDKDSYYQRLLQSKKFSQLKPIEKQQYEYYSAWYHPAVRELVISKDFDGSPEWIAKKLSPPITPLQAAKSIELLSSLGFIKKNGNGGWEQCGTIISTGPELTSLVVHNYHKILLDLSKNVMDELSLEYRDTSAMTLGVPRQRLPQLRDKIREFRQEILKLVANDTSPEEVAFLNIQFYPVTKIQESTGGNSTLRLSGPKAGVRSGLILSKVEGSKRGNI